MNHLRSPPRITMWGREGRGIAGRKHRPTGTPRHHGARAIKDLLCRNPLDPYPHNVHGLWIWHIAESGVSRTVHITP